VIGAGRVSMIHFDAHADTGFEFGSLWGHGQPMRRLIESGAVRGDRFLQVGLRGYWPPPETLDWMAAQRMRSYEMTEIVQRGLRECLTEAFSIATDDCDGVFLSVDHANITAALANRVVLEALCAIARKRKDLREGTHWDPLLPLLSERAAPIPEGAIQPHHHTHLGQIRRSDRRL
jgi:agmatinase